jgi:hypothetical protein
MLEVSGDKELASLVLEMCLRGKVASMIAFLHQMIPVR